MIVIVALSMMVWISVAKEAQVADRESPGQWKYKVGDFVEYYFHVIDDNNTPEQMPEYTIHETIRYTIVSVNETGAVVNETHSSPDLPTWYQEYSILKNTTTAFNIGPPVPLENGINASIQTDWGQKNCQYFSGTYDTGEPHSIMGGLQASYEVWTYNGVILKYSDLLFSTSIYELTDTDLHQVTDRS